MYHWECLASFELNSYSEKLDEYRPWTWYQTFQLGEKIDKCGFIWTHSDETVINILFQL